MTPTPHHRERQFMQQLRGRGWVKAFHLPHMPGTVRGLLDKRWIESQGRGADLAYRITAEGMAAKIALVRISG